MTGTQLLEALSFVDERYIEEADVPTVGRNTPWMKVLSAVACLCILITGVYAYGRMQSKGAMDSMKEMEAAAPEAIMEEAPAEAPAATAAEPEAAPLMPSAGITEESAEEKPVITDELYNIPYATLRIVSVADDHWIAVVEELPDEPVELGIGMRVKVVIDADEVPKNGEEDEARYGGILLPKEGLLAKIEDGAYDAGANILYITGAVLEEPPA